MTHIKRIFRQDTPCLRYAALGDTAVRVIAIDHLIRDLNLDAVVVPPAKPHLLQLWTDVFGSERVVTADTIPDSHRLAQISCPTHLDWRYGAAGWNVFESVLWENGYFRTEQMRITPPIVYRADHRSKSVMIYPAEATDGNRVFDSDWWLNACSVIREAGFKINLLGNLTHGPLKKFYEGVEIDRIFPPTIAGLRECVAASSCALGGSTGPTWALLLSDLPQVVLESKRSPHGYWHFDRCQRVLTKRLHVLSSLATILRTIS